jgi:RND family efflux transporter MFP subunit
MHLISQIRARSRRWLAVGLSTLAILGNESGCMNKPEAQKAALPVVGVVESKRMHVPIYAQPNGTTRALEEVAIRARVRGFLTEQHFKEGSFVKKGDLLLVIEEDTYKVALDSAKAKLAVAEAGLQKAEVSKSREIAAAQLALDQAQLGLSQIEERRTRNLVTRTAASREDLDKAEAERKKWEAQVDADKANLEQTRADYKVNIASAKGQVDDARAAVRNAELDLGYCRMYAPFDGRIGEAIVKVGNLVGPTSAQGTDFTSLATIQQLDPMGVDVQVSSRYLERASRLVPKGLPLHLYRPGLEGDQEHPHTGHCFFIDNTIDKTTSTFLVKASIPNPKGSLLPGEYVKLRLIVDQIDNGVVVPEQAVSETQPGSVVYIVDKAGKVAIQRVDAAQTFEGLRVITAGLEAGVPVIVEGLQLVRPGIEVKTEKTVLARPVRGEAKADGESPAKSESPPADSQKDAPRPESNAAPNRHLGRLSILKDGLSGAGQKGPAETR